MDSLSLFTTLNTINNDINIKPQVIEDKDLEYNLNWKRQSKLPSEQKTPITDLNPTELKIYQLLLDNGKPTEIDHIAIKSQIPINQVTSILLALEFKNLIKHLPGKKYVPV